MVAYLVKANVKGQFIVWIFTCPQSEWFHLCSNACNACNKMYCTVLCLYCILYSTVPESSLGDWVGGGVGTEIISFFSVASGGAGRTPSQEEDEDEDKEDEANLGPQEADIEQVGIVWAEDW